MATKTKTSEPQAATPGQSVEKTFSEGLVHFNAGRLPEAAKAFQSAQTEAVAQELLNLARAARGYLTAVQARLDEQGKSAPVSPELSAQVLLNQGDFAGALALLDKASLAQPERAALHYLKALVLAQLDQPQEAADALTRAAELDADVLFQFRLESDFDGVRNSGPFTALVRG